MSMQQITQEDLERLIFFEQAKEAAEKDYKKNPNDNDALVRWGGSLLELAQFQNGDKATQMIEEAVKKFEEVLKKQPKHSQALWCLGNAHTSKAFLLQDQDTAFKLFDEAAKCFEKAAKADPGNEMYKKALQMSERAPAVYKDLQAQLASQGPQAAGPAMPGGRQSKAKPSDFWWDVAGWATLVGLMLAMSVYSRYFPPPAPPQPGAPPMPPTGAGSK